MMNVKNFFGIDEKEYKFEWCDITTIITVFNVIFVLMGFWWAPVLGIANGILNLVLNVKYHTHINMYIMQIALLILNGYFLTL